ncbi:hypothetical protein [Mucilaginibacter robiniae]|nr:hypothetical protein [Mucilaginibacter robiniae]
MKKVFNTILFIFSIVPLLISIFFTIKDREHYYTHIHDHMPF